MATSEVLQRARELEREAEELRRSLDPTIIIDFPWTKTPRATCYACNQPVSNVNAKRHALITRTAWEEVPGCGIEYRNVTTSATDPFWQGYVSAMRPELEFVAGII